MRIHKPDNQLNLFEIDATLDQYRQLSDWTLLALASGARNRLRSTDGTQDVHWERIILRIDHDHARLTLTFRDNMLMAEGSIVAIAWLAGYFSDLSVSPNFQHAHIEWHEGHLYLSEQSTPLIANEVA
jgi:hypothetical protein